MRRLPNLVRRALAQLNAPGRSVRAVVALLAIGLVTGAAGAAPAPVSKKPAIHVPTTAVHTEFVVETNRLGQVTRVRSGVSSKDLAFNAMTYGNALQAFIRTQSGGAVAGSYRLAYDYSPKSKAVRRSVALLRAGGVNPNAPGAVTVEQQKLAKQTQKAKAAARSSPSPLPDLKTITGHGH